LQCSNARSLRRTSFSRRRSRRDGDARPLRSAFLDLDRSTPRRFTAGLAAAIAGALVAGACSSAAPKAGASRASRTQPSSPTTAAVVETTPFAFTVRHVVFVDTTRPTASPGGAAYSPSRTLPTDVYLPTASTPRPLIMFSHGYHGAPRKFTQLFSAWARAGFAVAAPRFPLTSDRGAPYDAVGDYVNQPRDISFVLTQLLHGPLRSHFDAARIGAAGLSLGGGTTYNLIDDACCRDSRIRAAAVFDAVHIPIGGRFEPNRVPLLIAHIDSDVAVPYQTAQDAYAASVPPKWFLTFHTGLHPEAYENSPSPHDQTATSTSIDFFDLTLLGDAPARARLLRDGSHPGESTIVAG
jgi:dienelactone hydrolase